MFVRLLLLNFQPNGTSSVHEFSTIHFKVGKKMKEQYGKKKLKKIIYTMINL